MATEAEKKLEEHESREDARKDSEEMPVWAADMMKKMDSMHERMDAMEKGREDRKDSEAEAKEEKRQAGELEKLAKEEREEGKREERKDAERKDAKEEKDCRMDESAKEEEHKAGEELAKGREKQEREDRKDESRARADAAALVENRVLKGQLAALEAQVKGLYREPSFDDANAIAETRARADATYQAVTGRPASAPLPGESPISYRKRMADGLRKFSAKFKEERVDSLSGAAFEIVEGQIYADAMAAAKRPENLPPGQLRKIVRNDSGHTVTEYMGDPKAAWRNFMTGAVMGIELKKPSAQA